MMMIFRPVLLGELQKNQAQKKTGNYFLFAKIQSSLNFFAIYHSYLEGVLTAPHIYTTFANVFPHFWPDVALGDAPAQVGPIITLDQTIHSFLIFLSLFGVQKGCGLFGQARSLDPFADSVQLLLFLEPDATFNEPI
jgi:hypothetical protein